MNTKQLTLAILIVAATAAVALTPYLSTTTNSALAKKTCTIGQSSNQCNEHNRNTPAAHCRNPVGKEVNCHGS
jgi:hypothetical protein